MIVETEVKLTPKQLAEQFWELYDGEQAEFFEELFNITGMKDSYFSFESQAYHLHKSIRESKNEKAKEALMSLSAPFFLYSLNERYS